MAALKQATATSAPRTSGVSPFMELEIYKIRPNPNQPRKSFDPVLLGELADSIKAQGLIQPIAVVKTETGYMIVSGERRFEACKILGLNTIKAHILEADSQKVQELALIENIQRDDLTDFEISSHIVELWKSGFYTEKQELAQAIGKTKSYVSKAFAAMNVGDEIIEKIHQTKQDIPLSVLSEIGRIDDTQKQREVYDRYTSGEITRDEIKKVAKNDTPVSRGKPKSTTLKITSKGCDIQQLIDELMNQSVIDTKKRYKITIEEIQND